MPVYVKNGLNYCVYYNGRQRIWEPFGRGDEAKRLAHARDLEIKLKKARGEWQTGRLASMINYNDLCQLYINARHHDLAENTRNGILRTIRIYGRPVIGKKPINMINLGDWQKIQTAMTKRDIKNRTINTYFKYLSKVLTWAIEENDDLLDHHPWGRRKPLKEKRFNIELFRLDELQRIIDHAEPHVAWALEVAYHTGARTGRSELFRLKWSDIELENSRIRIRPTKTDADHWQYLLPDFVECLRVEKKKTRKQYPDCPWVCHYKGEPINSIKKGFATAKKKAGIGHRIRLTDVRHYHITYALANGADIHELAKRVGHKNPRMIVDVYSHLAKDILKNTPHTLPKLNLKTPPIPPDDILR